MKINLAIDCLDSAAVDTITTLHSFLSRNKWFNGKVYVIIPSHSTLTPTALSNLTSIYSDLETSCLTEDSILLNQYVSNSSNLDIVQKILTARSLLIPEEKVLFISSGCLFLKDMSSILNSNSASASVNLSGEIEAGVFYRNCAVVDKSALLEKIRLFNWREEPLSDILSLALTLVASPTFEEKSSQFNDRVFMKKKQTLSSLHFIRYDTLRNDVKISSKINHIWLQHKNLVFNLVKKPSFRSGKTIIAAKVKPPLINSNLPAATESFQSKIEPAITPKKIVRSNVRYPTKSNQQLISVDELNSIFSNKNVCMVANSSDLLNDRLGEFIDSHDCVVRFNSFKIDPDHTGVKTTIHSSIYLENSNLNEIVDYRMIVSINRKNWINKVNSLDSSKQSAIIDSNWPLDIAQTPLQYRSNRIPTTGFNMILLFKDHINYSKLSLVGFNFYRDGAQSVYRKEGIAHDIAKVHNYSFEERWIKSVFSEKNKIFIHEKGNSV